jgi:uncharacterized protein (DUF488 family)
MIITTRRFHRSTSAPTNGESLEHFLAKEGERYRQQLQTYTTLMSHFKPGEVVRAALYFPMIDGWIECPE